ncbi:hypothetical protein K6L59_03240 [Candidatus Phytoplasma sp. Tabriz.2]|nr:hypothetical protein [Candidatus Phytoplasma australiense]
MLLNFLNQVKKKNCINMETYIYIYIYIYIKHEIYNQHYQKNCRIIAQKN